MKLWQRIKEQVFLLVNAVDYLFLQIKKSIELGLVHFKD